MKTAILESLHSINIVDLPSPQITRSDQVKIAVKAVGICGSEVHAYEGTHPYRKAPVILGHEAAGQVIEVGSAVKDFKIGDRVYVDPQWVCDECEFCKSGNINLCENKQVLGTERWPGAFGEIIVVPAQSVFHLADHLNYIQGAMIEPLTVGVHVARRAKVQPGNAVAILGSGSIGGLLSGVCRTMGAESIVLADIRQHCMDAARERLGATHDILLPDPDVIERMASAAGGNFDVVFIAADDPSLVNLGLQLLKKRGKLVLVALLNEAPLTIQGYALIEKEIKIIGSLMSNHSDIQYAEKLVRDGLVDVEGIVTHHLSIDEAQKGMEIAKDKTDDAIKVILNF